MDISASSPHPFFLLSNYAKHPFIFDGVLVNSMEGFLQSLKLNNPADQKRVCLLVGMDAKMELDGNDAWQKTQILHWQGRRYRRDSVEYGELIDRAYCTMMESNPKFAEVLRATVDEPLANSVGTPHKTKTSLSSHEFIAILVRLRNSLKPDLINTSKPAAERRMAI